MRVNHIFHCQRCEPSNVVYLVSNKRSSNKGLPAAAPDSGSLALRARALGLQSLAAPAGFIHSCQSICRQSASQRVALGALAESQRLPIAVPRTGRGACGSRRSMRPTPLKRRSVASASSDRSLSEILSQATSRVPLGFKAQTPTPRTLHG
jgi:hypothetical protein